MIRNPGWLRRRQAIYATAQIFLMWALWPTPANAALQESLQEQIGRFAVPGASWQAVQTIRLSGVRLQSAQFSSSESPLTVVRALSDHPTVFQRVLTTRGAIILSGLGAGQHWLAEIQPHAAGTTGRVSALPLGRDAKSAHGHAPTVPYEWLPSGAATRFSYHDADVAGNVLQHIFSIPMPADAVSAYVSERLRTDGWVIDPLLASASGHNAWHRRGKQLVLGATARGEASLLYVYQQQ